MALSNYLVQRGKRGIWQLRVPVPRPLQARFGKRERIKSMGTTDRAAAERQALPLLVAWQAEWNAAVGGGGAPAEPQPPVADLALEQYRKILEQIEDRRRAAGGGDEAQDQMVKQQASALSSYIRSYKDGKVQIWKDVANRMIEKRGLSLVPGMPEYDELVEGLARATIDALDVFTRSHAGELDAEPRSNLLRAAKKQEADTAPAGERLLDLFDRYAEQRGAEGAKRPDVLKQDRKVIEQFAEFVGRSRRVETITPEDVRDFRDTLRKLPPRWRELKDLAGLNMRDAALKAEKLELARVALTTVNKYISTISPLFTWMIEQRYNIPNPCDGLLHQGVKGKNPRPPFSSAQLNTIFASPLFVGFLANGKEHLSGGVRADDWRYWIPLLAMFTGARIGELAQIHVDDIERHDSGVWFIVLRHDEAKGQTTKSGHSRPAIIHSALIALGFLDFVERQADRAKGDNKRQLFPDLVANDRDQLGAVPSRFLRDYLTDIGIKTGRDGFGAHSFRHTMADRLRDEAGLLDDQVEVALGHNQKTVTGGYGRIRQGTVPVLSAMVEQVTFKGVDLQHLGPVEPTPNAEDRPA